MGYGSQGRRKNTRLVTPTFTFERGRQSDHKQLMLASGDIASCCGLAENSMLKLVPFVGVTAAGKLCGRGSEKSLHSSVKRARKKTCRNGLAGLLKDSGFVPRFSFGGDASRKRAPRANEAPS